MNPKIVITTTVAAMSLILLGVTLGVLAGRSRPIQTDPERIAKIRTGAYAVRIDNYDYWIDIDKNKQATIRALGERQSNPSK